MVTLRALIEDALDDYGERVEDIEAIVVGPNPWGVGPETGFVESTGALEDYDGECEYSHDGKEQFPNLYVWTADRVYCKATHDSMEWIVSVPRHPTDAEDPQAPGYG